MSNIAPSQKRLTMIFHRVHPPRINGIMINAAIVKMTKNTINRLTKYLHPIVVSLENTYPDLINLGRRDRYYISNSVIAAANIPNRATTHDDPLPIRSTSFSLRLKCSSNEIASNLETWCSTGITKDSGFDSWIRVVAPLAPARNAASRWRTPSVTKWARFRRWQPKLYWSTVKALWGNLAIFTRTWDSSARNWCPSLDNWWPRRLTGWMKPRLRRNLTSDRTLPPPSPSSSPNWYRPIGAPVSLKIRRADNRCHDLNCVGGPVRSSTSKEATSFSLPTFQSSNRFRFSRQMLLVLPYILNSRIWRFVWLA